LATTIEVYAGGPGSGCQGPNCGRHKVGDRVQVVMKNADGSTYRGATGKVVKVYEGLGGYQKIMVKKDSDDDYEVYPGHHWQKITKAKGK